MGFNSFPCNPYPISTEELNKGNNDALNTRVTALEGDVSDLEEQKANQITIALPFNAETAYEVGDLVYYNGLSYRCTNAHQGEWDADDFAGTTIANELSALKSGLMSQPTDATKNSDYVGDSYVKVIRLGNMVNVAGRFEVTAEKPSGQSNYLFVVPAPPIGSIVPVYSGSNAEFIINASGYLTSNNAVAAGFYNIQATYSVTN